MLICYSRGKYREGIIFLGPGLALHCLLPPLLCLAEVFCL